MTFFKVISRHINCSYYHHFPHRITNKIVLKGTSGGHLVQSPAQSRANFEVRAIHRRIKLAEGLYDTGRIIADESH